ncbi:DUF2806 domain-containing protein [Pseudomonas putida]|uniref:DUF2806 domain-containing protein n=1 Tax=Pseudomonas putida TaxID=303 RepID=UPI003132FCEE
MANDFSLIDLKGLSEPLTKLVDSVSKGIGVLYEPIAKVRNAKADAASMLILADAKEKVDELTYRALERVTYQAVRRQRNIDSIVHGAAKYLPDEVSTEEVDEDWLVNFFNLGQDVGNDEMQIIWSKLLAGEVARPGSFKARTVNAVKSLSAEEANLFTVLCGFSFKIDGGEWVLPIFSHDFFSYIRANGFSVASEVHLKSIGLLSANEIWYGSSRSDRKIPLEYHSTEFLAFPDESEDDDDDYDDDDDDEIQGGFIQAFPFTETGMELARIAGGKPDFNYLKILLDNGSLEPFEDE